MICDSLLFSCAIANENGFLKGHANYFNRFYVRQTLKVKSVKQPGLDRLLVVVYAIYELKAINFCVRSILVEMIFSP